MRVIFLTNFISPAKDNQVDTIRVDIGGYTAVNSLQLLFSV